MAHFAKAAFPWIAMGLAIAFFSANRNGKEKTQENKKQ